MQFLINYESFQFFQLVAFSIIVTKCVRKGKQWYTWLLICNPCVFPVNQDFGDFLTRNINIEWIWIYLRTLLVIPLGTLVSIFKCRHSSWNHFCVRVIKLVFRSRKVIWLVRLFFSLLECEFWRWFWFCFSLFSS